MELNLITGQMIDNIIANYNRNAHANLQYQTVDTRDAVTHALSVADSAEEVRAYVREHAKKEQHLQDLMQEFALLKKAGALGSKPESSVTSQPVREMTADEAKFTATVNLMGNMMTELLSKVKLDDLADGVVGAMKDELRKFILDEYGPIKKRIEIEIGDKTKEIEGVLHKQFPKILDLVIRGFYPYLVGPSGTGKSYICRQIAQALGREFYFTNAVTQEYQLKGFTDASGKYQETQFYKAFKDGGVFLIDELDGSIPEALLIINDALANGYFDFPAPIGKVFANPKFTVVAAGNTYGHGASSEYVARNQIDAASMDRFKYIEVDYDPTIEESLANGDKDLLGFIRAYRKACKEAGIQTIVSYRAISGLAEMSNSKVFTLPELMWTCLTKGLEKSDLQMVRNKVSGFGKYSLAFEELCK